MYPFPGHVSTAYILARSFSLSSGVCIFAALFPDIFDKPLRYVFHILPYGRSVMHSLAAVVVMSLAVSLILNRRLGISWCVGHLSHILGDYFTDVATSGSSFMPWLFPFKKYAWPENTYARFHGWLFIFEFTLLIAAAFIFFKSRKPGKIDPAGSS